MPVRVDGTYARFDEVQRAIIKGCTAKGWTPTLDGEGQILASILVRSRHFADGLKRLIQPQWSGTVTLETTWAVSSARTGAEIVRRSVLIEKPASFSKKREATELAAQSSIVEGIEWLVGVVEANSP